MNRRVAILVANQDFNPDSGLAALQGPLHDVDNLSSVLRHQEMGQFVVHSFVNATSYNIKAAIDEQLGKSGKGDLILIYYTGHGMLDRAGNLCLATTETRSTQLQTTSIPSKHLRELVENSDCDAVILILDCCYSGAATNSARGDVESQLISLGDAGGLYILSATNAIQTATEAAGDKGEVLGDFTAAMLEGIRTGSADYNHDGRISLQEIFKFVKTKLKRQTPKLYAARAGGDPTISLTPPSVGPEEKRSRLGSTSPKSDSADSRVNPRSITLALLHTISHPQRVVDIAFDRADSKMATVCDDGIVRLFDTRKFKQEGRLQSRPNTLRSASWSKGGQEIATSDSSGRIMLWRRGAQVGEMKLNSVSLTCAQYSPDGLSLVAGAEDGTISLWQPQRRELLWSRQLHRDVVSSLCFSSNGHLIVSASYDGQAIVLDRRDGAEVDRFTKHSDQLTAAFFLPGGWQSADGCVSAGLTGQICIWPLHHSDSAFVAAEHGFWVKALAHCECANLIVSGGFDASIRIIDLATEQVFEAARVASGPVTCVRNSHREELLAVGTHDGLVYLLSLTYRDLS